MGMPFDEAQLKGWMDNTIAAISLDKPRTFKEMLYEMIDFIAQFLGVESALYQGNQADKAALTTGLKTYAEKVLEQKQEVQGVDKGRG